MQQLQSVLSILNVCIETTASAITELSIHKVNSKKFNSLEFF